MLDFFYLCEAKLNSNDLIDLLGVCQEYILSDFKLAIEAVFANNLEASNFVDIYMVAKAFDCHFLQSKVIEFAKGN